MDATESTLATVFLLLLIANVVGVLAVRAQHRTIGSWAVGRWRFYGREWARFGEQARSEWCHAWADYYTRPWWDALWFAQRPPLTPPSVAKAGAAPQSAAGSLVKARKGKKSR